MQTMLHNWIIGLDNQTIRLIQTIINYKQLQLSIQFTAIYMFGLD